jgi:hypothetical protein
MSLFRQRVCTQHLPTTGPLRNAGSSSLSVAGLSFISGALRLRLRFAPAFDFPFDLAAAPVEGCQLTKNSTERASTVCFLGMCSVGDEKSSDISAYKGRYFFLGGAGSSSVLTTGSAFTLGALGVCLRLDSAFDFPFDPAGAPVNGCQSTRVDWRIKSCNVRLGVLSEGGGEKSSSISANNGRYVFLTGASGGGSVGDVLVMLV